MEQITSSYNLFVDSSSGHNSQTKGDDYMVNLQDAGVHAGEGEHIRMSLTNFSMAKNFTDVNDNNNEFLLSMQSSNAGNGINGVSVKLDNRNYTSVTDLATNFADKIGAQMAAAVNNLVVSAHTGMETITNDNIITFIVNTTAAHGYTGALIQFNSDISDSYALLGGDRVKTGDNTTPSISVTIPTATSVKITCKYPAQRSTMPFVYIRAPGVQNTNIETQGLRNSSDNHNSDVAHSNILGRAVVESQEWIQFTAQSERDFFIDIHQKQLNVLRLQLTDSKNRLIGRRDHSNSNTATGTGTEQSTLGNLSFSAVIRFDIIKRKSVHHLETEHYQPPIPARFSEGNVPIKIRS